MSIKGVWWLPLFRHSMAHNIFFIANSIGGVILSGRSCVSIFYDPSLLLHVPSFPGIPRTESWRIHRAILALLRRSGRSSGILSSSWRDISYSLPIARGFFRILQDSSGFFRLVRNLLRRFEIEDALGGFQAIDKGFQGSSWILLGFSGILRDSFYHVRDSSARPRIQFWSRWFWICARFRDSSRLFRQHQDFRNPERSTSNSTDPSTKDRSKPPEDPSKRPRDFKQFKISKQLDIAGEVKGRRRERDRGRDKEGGGKGGGEGETGHLIDMQTRRKCIPNVNSIYTVPKFERNRNGNSKSKIQSCTQSRNPLNPKYFRDEQE